MADDKRKTPPGTPLARRPTGVGVPHRDYAELRRATPPGGVRAQTEPPQVWDDDSTPPTTDPALYRAIRNIKQDIKAQADELGAVTTEVALLKVGAQETKEAVKKIDEKQDHQTDKLSTISGQLGILLDDRHRHLAVTQTRAIMQSTTTETLADHIVREQALTSTRRFTLMEKVIGGVFSAGVLTAVIAALADRC